MEALSDRGLGAQGHYVEPYLLDHLRRNCRPSTIRTNGSAVLLFLSYLKEIGRTPLETVTREDVSAFIEHEQDRGLKPSSMSGRLRSVHAFLNFLIARDWISPNVLKRKMRIKIPDSLPRAIDPEDIKKLLAVIRNTRDRAPKRHEDWGSAQPDIGGLAAEGETNRDLRGAEESSRPGGLHQ
jgi:site-specific recombinase XerD